MNNTILTIAPVAIGLVAYLIVGAWVYDPLTMHRFNAIERMMICMTAFILAECAAIAIEQWLFL